LNVFVQACVMLEQKESASAGQENPLIQLRLPHGVLPGSPGARLLEARMFRLGLCSQGQRDTTTSNGFLLRSAATVRADRSLSLLYVGHVDRYGTEFFRLICEKKPGGESMVAKHRASTQDSTAKWIKLKNPTYTQIG
jgi:hypothetical protein